MSTTTATTTFSQKVATLTQLDLVAYLSSLRGSKFLSLVARTDARLKKTGNPYGTVYKVSRVNVCVNFHYEAGVLRRLADEGKSADDFKRGESWHTPILTEDGLLTPLCSHKQTGEWYLRCQRLESFETTYFTAEGQELTRDEIAPFLPKETHYANQGLEAPLVFLTYKLNGIKEITLDGETRYIQENN